MFPLTESQTHYCNASNCSRTMLKSYNCLLPRCIHPVRFGLRKVEAGIFVDAQAQWGAGRRRVENWSAGSTNGKLIRDRRPPCNKLPALHHWLLTLKLFQQNITAAALSFMRNKFKAPRKVFRYSPEVAWMNCANHYDDSECKDRRHTAMIAGSIEDTWRQIADRRGLLGSQPKR